MTQLDELLTEVKSIKSFVDDKVKAGIEPTREEVVRLLKAYEQTQKDLKELRRERAMKTLDGRLVVRDGRLAGFDMFSLRIAEEILKARIARGHGGEKTLQDVFAARKSLTDNFSVDSFLAWEDNAIARRKAMVGREAAASSLRKFTDPLSAFTRAYIGAYTKALDSSTSAKGDELVPTFEAGELWMDVNLETLVLPLIPQSTMPTNPFDIPLQLGDTQWYPTSENVQVTTTDVSTAKQTLTAYGLKTGVPFSDELEEEAVLAFVPELRNNLVRNAAEIIDDVILNADTTVTNNINADGATIAKSTAGKGHWLLGFDGIVHLPIVDYSTMGKDLNGVVTADAYNLALAKIGKYGVARRRGDVVYVVDVYTGLRSMSISEVETLDTAGARATISTGELASIYGIPIVRSEQLLLADTDGKVTSAGNGTNTGRILCLNTQQWRVGFRRQITVETDREAGKSQTTMYVSFRIALMERTGTRSSATHTSCVYDITGVSS